MAATKNPLIAQRTSFHQGWHWLITAADQVARAPWLYLPALSWLLFVGSLQWLIPGAGSFLSGLLAPLSLAPLLLTYAQQQQHLHGQQKMLMPWKLFAEVLQTERLLPLLRLGFYLMIVVLVLSQLSGWLMSRWLDQDVLSALAKQDLDQLARMPKHELMMILMFTALPMAVLGILAWLSIPLVLFRQANIPQVLLISLSSSLRNWRALLALNILLIVLCGGALLMLLVINMVGHAISPSFGLTLSSLAIIAFSCFMQVCLVGAQYLACQAIFPAASTSAQNSSDDSGNPMGPEQVDTAFSDETEGNKTYWQA